MIRSSARARRSRPATRNVDARSRRESWTLLPRGSWDDRHVEPEGPGDTSDVLAPSCTMARREALRLAEVGEDGEDALAAEHVRGRGASGPSGEGSLTREALAELVSTTDAEPDAGRNFSVAASVVAHTRASGGGRLGSAGAAPVRLGKAWAERSPAAQDRRGGAARATPVSPLRSRFSKVLFSGC